MTVVHKLSTPNDGTSPEHMANLQESPGALGFPPLKYSHPRAFFAWAHVHLLTNHRYLEGISSIIILQTGTIF